MALHLHRASRTDQLADALGGLLATPLPDPFATEVVVVPARGVERWLSQRLSHRLGAGPHGGDGVCAGVALRSPWSLFAALTGTDRDDPWAPDALVWPMLTAIDEVATEPWAATLARHLGHGLADPDEAELRAGRRYAVARRLARVMAAYSVQRPQLVADWAAGRDTDGLGGAVPDDLAWQPRLWRRVVELVGGPAPTERHQATVTAVRERPEALDLPPRLSLFGHTRLAVGETELLAALAEHRDVHLWLPHPSDDLWRRLSGLTGPVPRRDDRSHTEVGHPLLAGLGRDTRELQRGLAGLAPATDELVGEPAVVGETLLGWLQSDLRANRVGPAAQRTVARADRSVQVHSCHSAARQVEVLRDVLLGLLADDPTLEPRDVLVMCPDVETYAPLIQAAFGLAEVVGPEGHPGHRLRVRLADRALDQTNPLLGLAGRLLDLAGGRAGIGEVLDLAHEPPVRRRFGLRDDDLEQLAEWAGEAGVRWGFDAEHRREFGLGSYSANTWHAGLDRLLAGVVLSDDSDPWADVLPVDDVGSGDVDLIGRLAELVDRLRIATDRLTGRHPLVHWVTALTEGVSSLCSVPAADAWQLAQLQRVLGELGDGGSDGPDLRLPDVRALVAAQVAGRPTRANFRTGTLTVATLVPMRSVPHRVVALLGMDDGVFPRVGVTDGDDLLARVPVTGERDLRSEDRQLFLDAILAATSTLVVTYTGANEFNGQPKPPAVPLGELLDALDVTALAADGPGGPRVSDQVTVHHPLQPFDRRNLVAGELVPDRPFSFDAAALSGARTREQEREPIRTSLLSAPLPPVVAEVVSLDDLVDFYAAPVKAFLKQRLGVTLPREEEPVDDRIPVETDPLTEWTVGDRVLADMLRGLGREECFRREVNRGLLPPGQLGARTLEKVMAQVGPLGREALTHRRHPPRSVEVSVDLDGGRVLRGTVTDVYGDRLVPVSYSRLGPKHRLASWVRLLALAASDEDRAWTSLTIGRPERSWGRKQIDTSQLGPLDESAARHLRDLVALRDAGLREPLPLPLKSSLLYARQRRTRVEPEAAEQKAYWEWRGGKFPGECADPEHVRAYGPKAPLPGRDRPGEGGEPSWFGEVSLRVWGPLLDVEVGSV